MPRTSFALWWATIVVGLGGATVFAQQTQRIIALEIKTPGAASEQSQQWAEILADVGADRVKITSADGARAAIDESEFGGQTLITVTGVLSRNGQLSLPGATFSPRDAGRIRQWIEQLRADGATVTVSEKMAFGLTADQLVGLNNRLAQPAEFDTKGQKIGDVVTRIRQELNVPLQVESSARSKLAGEEIVAEEMHGLSVGTVLAAAVRPLGLVVVPTRPLGGDVELTLVDSQSADEHWPVGWPIESAPAKTAPAIFERFNFELNQAPLSDALAAIEKKTSVPILYDHNALARDGLELSKIRVDYHKKKQTYFSVIDDLLAQSRPRLKLEIRVDEAQRPFLWISTIHRP